MLSCSLSLLNVAKQSFIFIIYYHALCVYILCNIVFVCCCLWLLPRRGQATLFWFFWHGVVVIAVALVVSTIISFWTWFPAAATFSWSSSSSYGCCFYRFNSFREYESSIVLLGIFFLILVRLRENGRVVGFFWVGCCVLLLYSQVWL